MHFLTFKEVEMYFDKAYVCVDVFEEALADYFLKCTGKSAEACLCLKLEKKILYKNF